MRSLFAVVLAIAVGGCFPPDLGDGAVACGANDSCPPRYFCHATDQRCWKTPDLAGVVDMSMPDDGSASDMMRMVDLGPADLSACTKAICGTRNCGMIPDHCGSVETCGTGSCPSNQSCGGGNPGMANVCASGRLCVPKQCVIGQDCGLISDGCASVLNCGMCSGGKMCGSDNKCH